VTDRSPNTAGEPANGAGFEVDPVMVTMIFVTDKPDALLDVLAKYAVMARTTPGCRNVDLVASTTRSGRFLVVEKWQSLDHQRNHFDSAVMVEMATACNGLLTAPPDIDLHQPVTMHDLA